jgi:hypothetical protein
MGLDSSGSEEGIVNMAMSHRISQIKENNWLAERLLASYELLVVPNLPVSGTFRDVIFGEKFSSQRTHNFY